MFIKIEKMRAYKFITKISENGVIQIPFNPALYNKEVEIIIVSKITELVKGRKATDFVSKWAGFLQDLNIDDRKYEYLKEKYK